VVYCNRENECEGGRKEEDVGVMKDKKLNLEEIDVSHTLGRAGKGGVQRRGKWSQGYVFY
jgi:hypothetical protein